MAFEGLSEKLTAAFKRLRGKGRLTENDVREAMREVRLALLEADVSYKVVKEFVSTVTERAVGTDVLDSLTPAQQVVKIVNEELTNLMGGGTAKLSMANNGPTVVMMVGLQGAGKTTTTAKLAGYMKKQHSKRPLLAACDVYRPAAIEQLKVLGEQIGIPIYSEDGVGDPVSIARNAVSKARREGYNVVIIDTAGRLAVDEQMMREMEAIKAAVNPTEILFVVDAMTGQDAVETAKAFNDRLDFDGVVLSKMDGDTRGGAALSIKAVVNKPIKFISNGEKMEALDIFYPKRIADRILGMGDVVSLVERAQEQFDEEQARRLHKKLARNQFTLEDFYQQIQQIKKMGNIKDLASMLPGVGKMLKDVDIDNNSFKGIEAIILSMTPYERENPDEINGSRRKRIAAGSGTSVVEVNRLLKQFEGTRKVMRTVAGGSNNIAAMMRKRR